MDQQGRNWNREEEERQRRQGRNRQFGERDESQRFGGEAWGESRDRAGWQPGSQSERERERDRSFGGAYEERSDRGFFGRGYGEDAPYDEQRYGGSRSELGGTGRRREDERGGNLQRSFERQQRPSLFDDPRRGETAGFLFTETWLIEGPHAGRGPKGYRRSDDRIREDVCDRLERHGQIEASEIDVKVSEGVVTLEGSVDDRRTKRLVEEVAENVYGVRDVMNQLKVDAGFFTKLFGGGDRDEAGDRSQRAQSQPAQIRKS